MKKVLKSNKTEEAYNPRYYKVENLELAYYSFEEGYKKLGDIFSKEKRMNKSEKIVKLLKYFEIKFREGDDFLEINTYSLAYLYLVIGLFNFGISQEKVKKYYKSVLESWDKYHYWKYLYAFYIYQAMAGYQVNFYIHNDFSLLLTKREFNALKGFNGKDNDLIVISLNNILGSFSNKDYSSKKDSEFHLNEEEQSLLFELNFGMYDKDEIRVKIKDWKIKELQIYGKEKDLSKTKKIKDSISHGEVGTKKYKNKDQYLKIREIKKLEKDSDNK